jgi:hypothetical protein
MNQNLVENQVSKSECSNKDAGTLIMVVVSASPLVTQSLCYVVSALCAVIAISSIRSIKNAPHNKGSSNLSSKSKQQY